MDKNDMRVCIHFYIWGCLKKGVPHIYIFTHTHTHIYINNYTYKYIYNYTYLNIYIYTYSHTYIYICVCVYFQILKDWYNFDLGECLKHRTQFSCSIYCKDKGDLEKTGCLFFIYYRYKNSTGSCFFCRSYARVRSLDGPYTKNKCRSHSIYTKIIYPERPCQNSSSWPYQSLKLGGSSQVY